MSLIVERPTSAQVLSDGTLSTTISQNGTNFQIKDGSRAGNNLFHSFSQFSVPTGSSASFNNATDVQNIFGRVTGNSASNIDGNIQANGTANLFLLNPNGIVFGPNASLNIGGSLMGTTASSIQFSDGAELSVNPTAPSLLTISAPIGLHLEATAGSIAVNGSGHTYSSDNSALAPVVRTTSPQGLQVNAGESLTLIGQGLTLNGGKLIVPSGYVTLASLENGDITWLNDGNIHSINLSNNHQFSPIILENQSLIDVSGLNTSSIQLYGSTITLSKGSLLLNQNITSEKGSDILVQASESLNLIGTNPTATIRSGIINETLGDGDGGIIQVNSQQLYIVDGASIFSRNYGTGNGGSIVAKIVDKAEISGFSPQVPLEFSSAILAEGFGPGQTGNVHFTSQNLKQTQGGAIGSITFGSGPGGDITVAVTDEINLKGANPFLSNPSVLGATTFGAANAGELMVTARRITVENGARIDSSTYNSGHAGQVTVQASEELLVTGAFPNSAYRSYIGGAALTADEPLRQTLGLPPMPTGNGGDVRVTAPNLKVTSGGVINVRNEGTGNAGELTLVGNRLMIEKGGKITADTASGGGGNITLQFSKLLSLQDQGLVSAEALGTGKGGNIVINSPIILGLDNSDIIANAFKGNGGNIKIDTQGILGLQLRNQITGENDITTSSQFGLNGSISINTIGLNPAAALAVLPTNLIDSSQQISQTCSNTNKSSFTTMGRGGISQNPLQQLIPYPIWQEKFEVSAEHEPSHSTAKTTPLQSEPISATSWRKHLNGSIELMATQQQAEPSPMANCG